MQYFDGRREMLQWYADYMDSLEKGVKPMWCRECLTAVRMLMNQRLINIVKGKLVPNKWHLVTLHNFSLCFMRSDVAVSHNNEALNGYVIMFRNWEFGHETHCTF